MGEWRKGGDEREGEERIRDERGGQMMMIEERRRRVGEMSAERKRGSER